MPRRLSRHHTAILAFLAASMMLLSCSNDGNTDEGADANESSLTTREISAGEVDVTATPTHISESGATFEIAFDTHSVELVAELPGDASLTVNGTEWPARAWDGDGPGGHHREGTLGFGAGGEPAGTARLSINGLPEDVEFAWNLPA